PVRSAPPRRADLGIVRKLGQAPSRTSPFPPAIAARRPALSEPAAPPGCAGSQYLPAPLSFPGGRRTRTAAQPRWMISSRKTSIVAVATARRRPDRRRSHSRPCTAEERRRFRCHLLERAHALGHSLSLFA